MEKTNEYQFDIKYRTINCSMFIDAMNDLCQLYTNKLSPEFKANNLTHETLQVSHESYTRLNVSNDLYSIKFEYYDYDTGSHYPSDPKMYFILAKGNEKQIVIDKNVTTIHIKTTSKHFENFCAYVKAHIEPILSNHP